MTPRLIVHGGAWNIPRRFHRAHISGCKQAVKSVYPNLKEGITALEAVEQAVRSLEADPTFDAGKGAFLNSIGEIELDALICDGTNLNFGAVAAVKNILHPVSLAKLVLNHPEHCFLVAEGAQQFLREHNFPEVDTKELLTERELEYYQKIKHDLKFRTKQPFEPKPMGTVGAVAMDKQGNFASATSTGGTPRKLPGRVGDSPIIGAGGYADNKKGAVSATGFGEAIMKIVLSKYVCDLFASKPGMEACQEGINMLQQRVDGLGGVIGITKSGDYAYAHNTPYMAFAYVIDDEGVISRIRDGR
jgi:beta-aspartyl-peptidase (threonine type)